MNTVTDFPELFVHGRPLIDVRAPVEFQQGAFPMAHNLPLLNNNEREQIGIEYRHLGQTAAIALGNSLVSGDVKAQRIQHWQQFAETNPNAAIYCFRGGLRSQISQQWLAEAGIELPIVRGGYKALRAFLINRLYYFATAYPAVIVSGCTGAGKTEVIEQASRSINLEGLARHRGSAFGSLAVDQPTQINFENALTIDWLKLTHNCTTPVLIENEARLIGRIALLPVLQKLIQSQPIVVVEASMEARVERILRTYVQRKYQQAESPAMAIKSLDEFARQALGKIQKRLGGVRYKALLTLLDQAIVHLNSQSSWSGFEQLIEQLLVDYYDPMYAYQQRKTHNSVLFKGSVNEVVQWWHQFIR